jgi:uncharacterized protein (DUF924 family)
MTDRSQAILEFWFGAPGGPDHGAPREIWFRGGPDFDATLAEKFSADYARAADGDYDGWADDRIASLGLILLLDQIPRNIFRGTAKSFATDAKALATARHAVDRGFIEGQITVAKQFFYLPFEHSEDLADQRQCLEFFETMEDHPDKAQWIDYARRHLVLIERFGRFPHRNEILGRPGTAEEIAFLAEGSETFGTAPKDEKTGGT